MKGSKKLVASDKNHRPCLPLKPQEKFLLKKSITQ